MPTGTEGIGSRGDPGAAAGPVMTAAGPLGTHPAEQAAAHRPGRMTGWRVSWPLLAVLAVQALLSLRLVHANTPFQDEGEDLWAGRLLWAHWLHGTAIPPFPYYFSGSPVIYPPLGALANSAAGLAGARVLSLVFMLASTTLCWSATRRLFGRRAAFFAAALFAVLGPTLQLGAFATSDALAVLLVALAAWCVLTASPRGLAAGRMAAAGGALALATAAAYPSVLYDLVVPVVAVLAAAPAVGTQAALRRVSILLQTLAVLLAAAAMIAGSAYFRGFNRTILVPPARTSSPMAVLAASWNWAGLVVLLAVGGVVLSWRDRHGRARTWLLTAFTCAAVLGPAEQAWLHTQAVLNQYVGLGAWFAAVAAGYAIARFVAFARPGQHETLTAAACVAALIFPVSLGAAQSWRLATSWPNATSLIDVLRPFADHGTGRLLVEDPAVAEYYLSSGSQWRRWSSTRNIVLPSGANIGIPAGDEAVLQPYIARGYFSYVALNFADTTALDRDLATELNCDRQYHKIRPIIVPYSPEAGPTSQGLYLIWHYQPSRSPGRPFQGCWEGAPDSWVVRLIP
jgi:Dolichyl-phosphate-mannose-protein mannosyltransferase